MQPFDIHIPTRIFFGTQKADVFAEALAGLGRHAFVVLGGGSVEKLGFYSQVTDLLDRENIRHTTFRGIEPNPHAGTVNKAARLGKDAGVDFVLAFGGGSVMDASKAIAGLIHEDEEDIWPYVLGGAKHNTMAGALPVATIPTTAATASEVTMHAIISKPDVQGKAPVSYPFLKPAVSWLNPAFHTSLPLETTRDGASDILSHIFENYLLGGNDSPLADRYSEGVMETVMTTLPLVEKDPGNENLRGDLLWASTMALLGLQQSGRTPAPFRMHNLEHALSGYNPDLAHGRGLATIYPAYFRWLNREGRLQDRLAQLGHRLFDTAPSGDRETDALSFITAFEQWLRDNGLYQPLSDVGVPEKAFGGIADYALETYGDGQQLDVDGPLTRDGIIEIFEMTEMQG
ncbi:MAG: iron-containing alcohol dehydrogenase [Balneolaceae bacterium]